MKINRIGAALLAGCLVAGGAVAAAQTRAAAFQRFSGDTLTWFDYPGEGGKLGIKEAILYGDPAKPGLYVIRIKWPPRTMSRPHSHPEDRFITVIKGTWWTGTDGKWDPTKTTPVRAGGAMLHPRGQVHYDGARDEETIIELVGVGPSRLINASPGAPDFAKF
jgi:quercetin dioxygenase-like cupin family protein